MKIVFRGREWAIMKKMMIGLILGIGLTLGISVYADEIVSLVGKKVDGSFPLIINNIRADKDVLVIDGTSYIPVRSASTLFGYDVSFNADLMVVLTKKAETVVKQPAPDPTVIKPANTPEPTASIAPAEKNADTIDEIKTNIIGMNSQISVVIEEIKKKEALIKSIQNDTNQSAKLQTTKEELTNLKSILSGFNKQLDKLNKSLKEQK
jgi:hypothetical protein